MGLWLTGDKAQQGSSGIPLLHTCNAELNAHLEWSLWKGSLSYFQSSKQLLDWPLAMSQWLMGSESWASLSEVLLWLSMVPLYSLELELRRAHQAHWNWGEPVKQRHRITDIVLLGGEWDGSWLLPRAIGLEFSRSTRLEAHGAEDVWQKPHTLPLAFRPTSWLPASCFAGRWEAVCWSWKACRCQELRKPNFKLAHAKIRTADSWWASCFYLLARS